MSTNLPRCAVLTVTFLLCPELARADGPVLESEPELDPVAIEGGQDAGVCAFPTAVSLKTGECTGTLVHPEVVVFASHCRTPPKPIIFGEKSSGGHEAKIDFCKKNEAFGGVGDEGHDWAFCKLAEPIDHLPIAPILYGCETDVLQVGAEIYMVGFGEPGWKVKSFVKTSIISVTENTVRMGGSGQSACPGDSGGPAFMQLEDGTWRAVGIASTLLGSCGAGTNTHARMDGAIGWLEAESGVDLTPCFASDGTWEAGRDCGRFIASGPEGHGSWDSWCSDTPTGGPSATCGEPFESEPDADPPHVAITSPPSGESFDLEGEFLDISIEVDADDGDGWGVKRVMLHINDKDVGAELLSPPFVFESARFYEGTYELVAVAEDHAGNIGESDVVGIGVGVDAPAPEDDPSDDGDGGTDGPDGEADDGGTGDGPNWGPDADWNDNREEGCGCGVPRRLDPSLLMLVCFALVCARRRS